jgi:iron(III) transport system permease protein
MKTMLSPGVFRRLVSSGWFWMSLLVVVLISFPLLSILSGFSLDFFLQLPDFLSADYAVNTYSLVFLTAVFSLLFGVPSAWFVASSDFSGRKYMEWLLMLPLAIPSYIAAYTYKGILGPYGTIHSMLDVYMEVDELFWLSVIMASVLYPYVYIISRAVFYKHSARLQEASYSLGYNRTSTFFKVVLPLARPAIFSGMMLVIMEVINNYGAVSYYGITTFTTEILRLWNPLSMEPVMHIAGTLLMLVALLLWFEKLLRRKQKFYGRTNDNTPLQRRKLKTKHACWAILACALPILLGFLIPVVQLFVWAQKTYADVLNAEFISLLYDTFITAFWAVLACVLVALLIRYTLLLMPSRLMSFLSGLSVLGYSIPGAVVALAVLVPLSFLAKSYGLVLTGSFAVLIFAYVIRFQAVSYNTIDSGFEKMSPYLNDAARSLGNSPAQSLRKVIIPQIKTSLLSAVILIFVDVSKELPLTMMFQSFNFETLAVRSFILMETDGAVYDSAVPALIIVLIGLIPILFLNKLTKSS